MAGDRKRDRADMTVPAGPSDDATRPMTVRETAALRRLSVSTGIRTGEDEIDRITARAAEDE